MDITDKYIRVASLGEAILETEVALIATVAERDEETQSVLLRFDSGDEASVPMRTECILNMGTNEPQPDATEPQVSSRPTSSCRLTDRQTAVLAAVERLGSPTIPDLHVEFPDLNPSTIWSTVEALANHGRVTVVGNRMWRYVGEPSPALEWPRINPDEVVRVLPVRTRRESCPQSALPEKPRFDQPDAA